MKTNELQIIFKEIFEKNSIQNFLTIVKEKYKNDLENIIDNISRSDNEKIYRILFPEKSPNIQICIIVNMC